MSSLRIAAAQYPVEFVGSWEGWRLKLETWIALSGIHAVGAELKKIETGALALGFTDGSAIRRESTRRKQLTAFAAAVEAQLSVLKSSGLAPPVPTPGAEPVGLYGWSVPLSALNNN